MAWLARLLKATESFAEHVHKKPIWIITTVVWCSCLGFIASYQSSRPEEQARIENATNDLRVGIEDSERAIRLYEEILTEEERSTTATDKFRSIIHDIRASGQWTGRKQQVEENHRLAVEARGRIEIIIAKLQGTTFRVPYLNDGIPAKEGSLKTVASTLKMIEELWAPYLTDDVKRFTEQVLQSEDRIEGIIKELETARAQAESELLQSKAAVRSNQLELRRTVERAERHHNKGLLHIPALIFSVGYIIFIFRGIREFLKKPNRVILRSKRVAPIPKKRRKNDKIVR